MQQGNCGRSSKRPTRAILSEEAIRRLDFKGVEKTLTALGKRTISLQLLKELVSSSGLILSTYAWYLIGKAHYNKITEGMIAKRVAVYPLPRARKIHRIREISTWVLFAFHRGNRRRSLQTAQRIFRFWTARVSSSFSEISAFLSRKLKPLQNTTRGSLEQYNLSRRRHTLPSVLPIQFLFNSFLTFGSRCFIDFISNMLNFLTTREVGRNIRP